MASEFRENDHAVADDTHDSVESADVRTFRLPKFTSATAASALDCAGEVAIHVELGRAYVPGDEVAKLSEGSVVALDSQATEPVDVYVAGALVARGELQTFEEKFCVRVTEVFVAGAKSRAA